MVDEFTISCIFFKFSSGHSSTKTSGKVYLTVFFFVSAPEGKLLWLEKPQVARLYICLGNISVHIQASSIESLKVYYVCIFHLVCNTFSCNYTQISGHSSICERHIKGIYVKHATACYAVMWSFNNPVPFMINSRLDSFF